MYEKDGEQKEDRHVRSSFFVSSHRKIQYMDEVSDNLYSPLAIATGKCGSEQLNLSDIGLE